MIERKIKKSAASFAIKTANEMVRCIGPTKYYEIVALSLELGAQRAFEWLENNGYKVVKND
jgi:hypothetical protein